MASVGEVVLVAAVGTALSAEAAAARIVPVRAAIPVSIALRSAVPTVPVSGVAVGICTVADMLGRLIPRRSGLCVVAVHRRGIPHAVDLVRIAGGIVAGVHVLRAEASGGGLRCRKERCRCNRSANRCPHGLLPILFLSWLTFNFTS